MQLLRARSTSMHLELENSKFVTDTDGDSREVLHSQVEMPSPSGRTFFDEKNFIYFERNHPRRFMAYRPFFRCFGKVCGPQFWKPFACN